LIEDWLLPMQVLSIMAAFGAVAVGTITYFYQKKQHRQKRFDGSIQDTQL
jgi:hypothetical protein